MSSETRIDEPIHAHGRFFGVTVGIVTNLNDPEGLGRVKLKLPWLDDLVETPWARLLAPMAGASRGLALPPEVGDEVLVAFEHGAIEFPYVLGGLWGGRDKPPPAVEAGKVKRRGLTTAAGHSLEFLEDDGGGKGAVTLSTATGRSLQISDSEEGLALATTKHVITLDDQSGTLEIEALGTLVLKAGQCKLSFGDSGIELAFQGATLKLSAQGVELSSNSLLSVKAAGKLDLQTNGVLTIRGNTVMIN